MPEPLRLDAELRERVWGRTRLAPWFQNSDRLIGEAWYLAGSDLPLLVKLLFTSERLSVQVHPDDGEDGQRGKTEMWHILAAEPGATIALGFREPITRERLWDASRTGEVEHLLNWMPVKAGETYFTPAHTVHAIGAGVVLAEIQQNCDLTYRLWDYGRARETHLEKAIPICDLGVHPGPSHPVPLGERRQELVRSKHFITEVVTLPAGASLLPEHHECHLWMSLEGEAAIGGQPVAAGQVWLLPEPAEVRALTPARFLRTWVP